MIYCEEKYTKAESPAKDVFDINKDNCIIENVSTETFAAHNGTDVVTVSLIHFTPVSKEEKVFQFEFII